MLSSHKKIDLLKEFLQDKLTNQDTKEAVNKASSPAEIYHLLAKHREFAAFSQLITRSADQTSDAVAGMTWDQLRQLMSQEDITPTAEELNQCSPLDNTPFWFWLAVSDEGAEIFKILIDQETLPSLEALETCRTTDDTHTWFWLTGSDKRAAIFEALMKQGRVPSAEILEKCRTTDNTHTWFWLSSTYKGAEIFETLIDKRIFPSREALENCCTTDNTHTWFWLAGSDKRAALFEALMDQGFVPSAEALEKCCTTDNTHTWFWLAHSSRRAFIFEALMKQGRVPSAEVLEKYSKTDNTHTWFWLAGSDKGPEIFETLIDQETLPSREALEKCRTTDNTHTWFWLADSGKSHRSSAVFQTLIGLGIMPSAEALDKCDTKKNKCTWSNLSETSTFSHSDDRERPLIIFQTLLENHILPSADALNQLDNENKSTWFKLAFEGFKFYNDERGLSIFQQLMNLNIFPSATAMNAFIHNKHITVWHLLPRRRVQTKLVQLTPFQHQLKASFLFSEKGIQIYDDLVKKDILPIDKIVTEIYYQTDPQYNLDYLVNKYLYDDDEKIAVEKWSLVLIDLFQKGIWPTESHISTQDFLLNECLHKNKQLNEQLLPLKLFFQSGDIENLKFADSQGPYFIALRQLYFIRQFRFSNIPSNTMVARLALQQKENAVLQFLYLFYMTVMSQTNMSGKFTLDIWFHIAQYISPSFSNYENFKQKLLSDDNRWTFAKLHALYSIEGYLQQQKNEDSDLVAETKKLKKEIEDEKIRTDKPQQITSHLKFFREKFWHDTKLTAQDKAFLENLNEAEIISRPRQTGGV